MKLAFWKKDEDDLGLDKDLAFGKDLGADPFATNHDDFTALDVNPLSNRPPQVQNPMGMQQPMGSSNMPNSMQQMHQQQQQMFNPQQPFQVQQTMQQPSGPVINRDFEVINAKIDGIKISLESMNQRLQNIEQIARDERAKRW